MKLTKTIKHIFIALFSSLTIFALSSCFLTNEDDDDTVKAPTVVSLSTGVMQISFAPQSDMKYANIFRQSSTSEDFATVDKTYNIGQVVPETEGSLPSSFIFNDEYTVSTNYYRYFIRFCSTTSYYTYSEKSPAYQCTDTAEATLTCESSATLAGLDPAAYTFTYYKINTTNDYILNLNTPVSVPDSTFTMLDVVFLNTSTGKSKPFAFAEPETATPLNKVEADTGMDLQNTLCDGFFDTELTLSGLVAVSSGKLNKNSIPYTYYYWTVPFTDISIIQTLTDYDTDGVTPVVSSSPISTIKVPEPVTTDNGMDYTPSSSVISKTISLDEIVVQNNSAYLDFTPAD